MQVPITGLSIPLLCLDTYVEIHRRCNKIVQWNALIVKVRDVDDIAGKNHHINECVPHNSKQRNGKKQFGLIPPPPAIHDPQDNTQRTEQYTGYSKNNYPRFHCKFRCLKKLAKRPLRVGITTRT